MVGLIVQLDQEGEEVPASRLFGESGSRTELGVFQLFGLGVAEGSISTRSAEAAGLGRGSRRFFEDLRVTEVKGHFLLVPASANPKEAVPCAIVMEEDQMLSSLCYGLLQACIPVHIPYGLLAVRFIPIGQSCCPQAPASQLQTPSLKR